MSILQVTIYAALAAVAAALGPLVARARGPAEPLVGMASALAAGMMLGLAYPMMRDGLDAGAVAATAGAAAGVIVLFLLHVWFELDGKEGVAPARALLGASLHAVPEGLALGVACAVDARFGLLVAFTLALHNISEGIALASHMGGSVRPSRSTLAAVTSNAPQVALAVAGFALAQAQPWLRPVLLGGAAGSLVYLSLADLLPDGYRGAGRTAISVVVIAATGVVAFAEAAA